MDGSGSKLRTPSLDDNWCGMSIEVFSNPICLDGDDGSILLSLSSYITSSASDQLMLIGSDVAPLISNSLPGSIVQIHPSWRCDNHNQEYEFLDGTPHEVQSQMKNTSNLHGTPRPL